MAKKTKARENQELAHKIVSKFTHALTWREPFKTKWDRFYRLYRSELEEKNYPWQSNLFIPYAFSTVETVVPRLVSNRPQIDIVPREPEDQDRATIMNNLIDYQWDLMDMNVLLPEAVKEMAIYGTVILKVGWKKEEKEVISAEVVDEEIPELGTVPITEKKTVYDGPSVELVDLYDFFWDPEATDIDTAKWVIHRTKRSLDYLKEKQRQKIYKNINLLEQSASPVQLDDQKQQRRATLGISLPDYTAEKDDKDIELLEYWSDDKVCVVANRSVIIREEKNPYRHGKKPFIRCVDQKVPHEFLGVGEIEPIESLQYELNDRRNQRMDNITLALNRMFKVVNGKNVDEDELVSEAGGVVHMDSLDAVDTFDIPDVTSSSYQEETLIKADIQTTSGVTDFSRGTASDALANDTATGISLLQEASNARFRLKVQNIEDMLIKRLGELMVAMNEQFISEDQVIRIVGEEGTTFEKVKADEIRGNFDVSVVAGSTLPASESVEKKQIMEAYQLFLGDPEVDQKELKKMVMKAVMPKANIQKLFPQQKKQPQMGMPGEEVDPTAPDQTGMLQSMMSAVEPVTA